MKNIVVSIGLLASAMFSFCQEEYLKGTDFWTTNIINPTQSGTSWIPIPDSCVFYIYGVSYFFCIPRCGYKGDSSRV